MKQDQAEALALQALAHVISDDELLAAFMYVSGVTPDALRAGLGDPTILGSVLDFILQEDARVLAFAESIGIDPRLPDMARQMLPGGQRMHWT